MKLQSLAIYSTTLFTSYLMARKPAVEDFVGVETVEYNSASSTATAAA